MRFIKNLKNLGIKKIFLLIVLTSKISVANIPPENEKWFLGKWKFIGFIYHDEFKLPLNPKLILTFEFKDDGSDVLYWTREDETGFCERNGQYMIRDGFFFDEVTWINPHNSIDCGKDPDMQLGKKSANPILFKDGNIQINIGLAGEDFIYVFAPFQSDQKIIK